MGPIFLRIAANTLFKFKENEFEDKDELIYLSFMLPDDDDDVGGLFKQAHTEAKASLNQKAVEDLYCVLKVKREAGEIDKIIRYVDEEDFMKTKEEILAERENVVNTLEFWSQYLKSKGNPRSSIWMERDVESSDLIVKRNFCQINKILQF